MQYNTILFVLNFFQKVEDSEPWVPLPVFDSEVWYGLGLYCNVLSLVKYEKILMISFSNIIGLFIR